ncbi:hypothetical protein ACLOJK_003229 [Asimina triloba]
MGNGKSGPAHHSQLRRRLRVRDWRLAAAALEMGRSRRVSLQEGIRAMSEAMENRFSLFPPFAYAVYLASCVLQGNNKFKTLMANPLPQIDLPSPLRLPSSLVTPPSPKLLMGYALRSSPSPSPIPPTSCDIHLRRSFDSAPASSHRRGRFTVTRDCK